MPSSRAQAGPPDAGFTLIEVLCVVVILALTYALIAANGPSRSPAFTLRSEAATIADRLGAARGEAIASGHDVTVGLAADPAGLRIGRRTRLDVSPGISLAMLTADDHPTDATRRFAFRPDGSADGGGILVGNEAGRIAVRVAWLTGRVTVAPLRKDGSEREGAADAP